MCICLYVSLCLCASVDMCICVYAYMFICVMPRSHSGSKIRQVRSNDEAVDAPTRGARAMDSVWQFPRASHNTRGLHQCPVDHLVFRNLRSKSHNHIPRRSLVSGVIAHPRVPRHAQRVVCRGECFPWRLRFHEGQSLSDVHPRGCRALIKTNVLQRIALLRQGGGDAPLVEASVKRVASILLLRWRRCPSWIFYGFSRWPETVSRVDCKTSAYTYDTNLITNVQIDNHDRHVIHIDKHVINTW